MNLITAVAIILLIHSPYVATSIYEKTNLRISLRLPFMTRHSGDDIIQVIPWVDLEADDSLDIKHL